MRVSSLVAALGLAFVLAMGAGARAQTPVPGDAAAELGSLLFTEAEVAWIKGTSASLSGEAELADTRALYLSGILYLSPRTWTVWLNGQRVTPERWPEHVKGLSVERDSIEVKLRVADDEPLVTVRLRPNQSYIVATGEVVEGAAAAAIARRISSLSLQWAGTSPTGSAPLGATTATRSTSTAESPEADEFFGSVKARCAREWPGDYDMQLYCYAKANPFQKVFDLLNESP